MVMKILLLLLLSLSIISAFQFSLSRLPSSFLRLKMSSNCVVGENVPEEVMKLQAVNDMILVERFSSPEQTIGGVYIPKAQGADRKRLGKVISVPTEFSSITNTGRVRSPNELTDLKVGDVIVVEDAWGIGPWHYEVNNRFFSFHRVGHINAVVKKSENDNTEQ